MPFRRRSKILWLIMLCGPLIAGRSLGAQTGPWSAGFQVTYNRFSGGVTDSSNSRVLPTNRFGFTAFGLREAGRWMLRFELGIAPGHLAASDSGSNLELTQLNTSLPRYRLEPLVGRSIAHIGAGGLLIYLGATLDWWRLEGETRFTLGGEARLAVQAPLGRLVLENYLGFGLAPQPYPPAALTPDLTTHPTETLALGFSLRYRF